MDLGAEAPEADVKSDYRAKVNSKKTLLKRISRLHRWACQSFNTLIDLCLRGEENRKDFLHDLLLQNILEK